MVEDENRNNRRKTPNNIVKTCYGRLDYIIDFETQAVAAGSSSISRRRHLLAVITGCKTNDNADATRDHELVTYTHMESSSHVIDLNVVGAVIGRFRVEGLVPRWAIIDRSSPMARANFMDSEEGDLLNMYEN